MEGSSLGPPSHSCKPYSRSLEGRHEARRKTLGRLAKVARMLGKLAHARPGIFERAAAWSPSCRLEPLKSKDPCYHAELNRAWQGLVLY